MLKKFNPTRGVTQALWIMSMFDIIVTVVFQSIFYLKMY